MGRQVVVEGCKVVGRLTRDYDFDFDGRAPTFRYHSFHLCLVQSRRRAALCVCCYYSVCDSGALD